MIAYHPGHLCHLWDGAALWVALQTIYLDGGRDGVWPRWFEDARLDESEVYLHPADDPF
jgi:hypothetical protein